MADFNKSRQQQQSPLKCEICDKEYRSNNGLKYHFNLVHMLMKKHECNICQKVFKLQSQLTSHVKTVHEKKKYIIYKHINSVHNGQKGHKCDSCGKTLSSASYLKIHNNSVHNGQIINVTLVERYFLNWDI